MEDIITFMHNSEFLFENTYMFSTFTRTLQCGNFLYGRGHRITTSILFVLLEIKLETWSDLPDAIFKCFTSDNQHISIPLSFIQFGANAIVCMSYMIVFWCFHKVNASYNDDIYWETHFSHLYDYMYCGFHRPVEWTAILLLYEALWGVAALLAFATHCLRTNIVFVILPLSWKRFSSLELTGSA